LIRLRGQASGADPGEQRSLIAAADRQYPAAVSKLSKILLGPLADSLKNFRLALVVNGSIQNVPFAVLPVRQANLSDSGQPGANAPLLLSHEIVSIPSASVLQELREQEQNRRRTPKKSVVVIADPVFSRKDSRFFLREASAAPCRAAASPVSLGEAPGPALSASFARLLFSQREANNILQTAGTQESRGALGFRANVDFLMSTDLSHYQVLHFSTHSVSASLQPATSGLLLSLFDECGRSRDGILQLTKIFNLDLQADLVVLSGCDTAMVGSDSGWIGIVRGFLYAGAPRVVASLWNVDDASTAELMKYFYKEMLQGNATPAAALRLAQIQMLKNADWRSAYYWAPFVIEGDWN
jgi:CHAT domain-containing protein